MCKILNEKCICSCFISGILGTFTCCFLVYLGVQAGRILYTYTNVKSKVIRWITWGMICVSIFDILFACTMLLIF